MHDQNERDRVIDVMKQQGVSCSFHYVPLHSSLAGLRYGRTFGSMEITDNKTGNLLRLPLWPGLTGEEQNVVIDSLYNALQ